MKLLNMENAPKDGAEFVVVGRGVVGDSKIPCTVIGKYQDGNIVIKEFSNFDAIGWLPIDGEFFCMSCCKYKKNIKYMPAALRAASKKNMCVDCLDRVQKRTGIVYADFVNSRGRHVQIKDDAESIRQRRNKKIGEQYLRGFVPYHVE